MVHCASVRKRGIIAVHSSGYKVTGTIPIAADTIAFSPDGTAAYAEGYQGSTGTTLGLAVIDTASLAVTGFISGIGSGYAECVAVTPDGTLVYVGGPNGGFINTSTLQVAGHFQRNYPLVIH